MADSLPSLAFLGAGSMGGAILQGVVASGIHVDGGIVATNRTAEKAATLDGLDGVTPIALADNPGG
ncbi:MAG: NAD(P)-binding domain-containing protein, partial [Microbacterium sp.]